MTGSIGTKKYDPYIPQTLGEILDQLGSMQGGAPTFVDTLGDFPHMNIETEFFVLTESFKVVRRKLGDERYDKLVDLAARAKGLFAADPEEKIDNGMPGRTLLWEMEDIISDALPRRKNLAADG